MSSGRRSSVRSRRSRTATEPIWATLSTSALGEKALGAFPRPGPARSSKTTIPGRFPAQNPAPDFDRDYPSQQMPVISGETEVAGIAPRRRSVSVIFKAKLGGVNQSDPAVPLWLTVTRMKPTRSQTTVAVTSPGAMELEHPCLKPCPCL